MRPDETFIGQPIRSLQTMLRVIADQNGDETPLIPDGIYGPQTISAVSRFQRSHALPPTGITDQETWESIVCVYENAAVEQEDACPLQISMAPGTMIRKGDHGPNVALIQGILYGLSDSCGSIGKPSMNGVWDDATADSLSSFQELCSLPVTGNCDKRTWKNLALQYPLAANMGENGSLRNEYNYSDNLQSE